MIARVPCSAKTLSIRPPDRPYIFRSGVSRDEINFVLRQVGVGAAHDCPFVLKDPDPSVKRAPSSRVCSSWADPFVFLQGAPKTLKRLNKKGLVRVGSLSIGNPEGMMTCLSACALPPMYLSKFLESSPFHEGTRVSLPAECFLAWQVSPSAEGELV